MAAACPRLRYWNAGRGWLLSDRSSKILSAGVGRADSSGRANRICGPERPHKIALGRLSEAHCEAGGVVRARESGGESRRTRPSDSGDELKAHRDCREAGALQLPAGVAALQRPFLFRETTWSWTPRPCRQVSQGRAPMIQPAATHFQ